MKIQPRSGVQHVESGESTAVPATKNAATRSNLRFDPNWASVKEAMPAAAGIQSTSVNSHRQELQHEIAGKQKEIEQLQEKLEKAKDGESFYDATSSLFGSDSGAGDISSASSVAGANSASVASRVVDASGADLPAVTTQGTEAPDKK